MGAVANVGTRRMYSLGSLVMYVYPLATDVDDASTHATALNYVSGEWMNCTDTPTSSNCAGADVGEASGTLTFNLGEASRTGDVYVITPELE